MSRAFVSEDAAAANAAVLPERPVSSGANPVTPRGLALISAEIARLQSLHDATTPDDPQRPAIDRDLRYWKARGASAVLVPPATVTPHEVTFGCHVTLRRAGAAIGYQIVGEDEADPSAGTLSWTSPLAEALLGAQIGDVVDVGGGRPLVTIEALRKDDEERMAAQSGGDCAA